MYQKAIQLQGYPFMGRPVPEFSLPTIRQVLCGAYRIIYEMETEEKVVILTVHHQSRLLENNPAFSNENPEG